QLRITAWRSAPTLCVFQTKTESAFHPAGLSQLIFLKPLNQAIAGAHGDRHHRERGILTGGRTEAGPIRDKQILDVVGLIVGVEAGCLRIVSHASRSNFVNSHPWLLGA